MQTQKSNMVLWMALMCTSRWLGITEPVSGQCFTDNDDSPTSPDTVDSGSIDFAISLFKGIAKAPTLPPSVNCHISPHSVRLALIMTYMGARGNTKTQMQTALRLANGNQKQVLLQLKKNNLVHNATEASNYTLRIADKLYFDKNAQLRQCMVENLTPYLEQMDFRSAPEPSRASINTWVEDITNKKITNLLPGGSITSYTTMVIVNAIYMKAAWARTFEPRATYKDDFFIEPQQSKKVDMMRKLASFPYGASAQLDCTALEMPYSGNDLSMVVLLPDSKVDDLINKLNAENLKDLLGKLSTTRVNLKIPKFKITQSFELTKTLVALGVSDLFDSAKADLSGFTGSKNVFVTSVFHKTFIEVNEGGTEAAAATAVVVGTTSVIMENAQFKVDRPFIFLIRHIKSNSVLFLGLIKDPTAQG